LIVIPSEVEESRVANLNYHRGFDIGRALDEMKRAGAVLLKSSDL
jgi:hypothetical protein